MIPEPAEWNDAVTRVVHSIQSEPLYLINDGAEALMVVFDVPWYMAKEAILELLS